MLNKIIHKDILCRKKFYANELKNNLINYIITSELSDKQLKKELIIKKNKANKFSNNARFTNKCFLTGRNRGVHREFRLSRIALKRAAYNGSLYGLQKASW